MKNRRLAVTAAALFGSAGLAQAQFTETFDVINGAIGTPSSPTGWTAQNNSTTVGLTSWFQGNTAVFPQTEGAGYLGGNYNSTTGLNTISLWQISPVTTLVNGGTLTFYTRTVDGPFFPDRLQVRMNKANTSTNVGTLPTDVGDFTDLLLDINPTYTTTGYPNSWTEMTATISGVTGSVSGRLAFRYFVEGAGPSGANSDYIGIDFASYTLTPPPSGACCLATGCEIKTSSQCAAGGGTYAGNNVTCASIVCNVTAWQEQGEAGDLPGSAQTTTGSGAMTKIIGSIAAGGDADMYQINICDATLFSATTVGQTGMDTQLFLFRADGTGLVSDDDDPGGAGLQSTLSNLYVGPAGSGLYYLAISTFDSDPLGVSSIGEIWLDTPYGVERQPDGPAAAEAVGSWDIDPSVSGNYAINLTGTCFVGGTFGACCFGAPSYTCSIMSPSACTTAGGTYAGNGIQCANANCPQPPTGACCRDTGCSLMTQNACTAAGGTYAGNNVTCAAANCAPATAWQESPDAGDLPGTAQTVAGSGSLNVIRGTLSVGDADMYQINICSEANFGASTVGQTTVDTQLFLFNTSGVGVVMDDDDPAPGSGTLQSVITSQFVTANGNYYLAITQYNKDPHDAGNLLIWNNQNNLPAFGPEWAPNGPGAANAVASWDASASTGGTYAITLTGTCFVGAATCYANCDGSTGTPKLTGNDFVCFINKYNQGDPYANCDGSTGTPLLTGNDFVCFINRYNQGCP